MKLDDVRIGVRTGDGIVARLTDAVLVVPFDGSVDQAVDRLLAECRSGPVAGRLERVRAAAEGVASFAVVAEVGDTLRVFASGETYVAIAGSEPVLRLRGVDIGGWSVRVPDGFGTLEVGGLQGAPIDQRLDLRSGVVPGAGVVLSPIDGRRRHARPGLEASPPAVASRRRRRRRRPSSRSGASGARRATSTTPRRGTAGSAASTWCRTRRHG